MGSKVNQLHNCHCEEFATKQSTHRKDCRASFHSARNDAGKSATASAPGRVMLIGEHSVVYGKQALVASIDRKITVTLTLTSAASKQKDQFSALARAIETAIKKMLRRKTLPAYEIHIDSSLPIGVGLGSSAAFCVAYTKALLLLLRKTVSRKIVYKIALEGEKVAHGGSASGADVAASLHQGMVSFQKMSRNSTRIQPLSLELTHQLKKFLIIDSGPPAESTKQLVTFVASKITNKRVRKILRAQAKLAVALLKALNENDTSEILSIIKFAEQNLDGLAVVSKKTREIIRAIELAGGAAKITGAGGIKTGSGMLLAYHPNPQVLANLVKQYAWDTLPVEIGARYD